jgi:hypothetical protein
LEDRDDVTIDVRHSVGLALSEGVPEVKDEDDGNDGDQDLDQPRFGLSSHQAE